MSAFELVGLARQYFWPSPLSCLSVAYCATPPPKKKPVFPLISNMTLNAAFNSVWKSCLSLGERRRSISSFWFFESLLNATPERERERGSWSRVEDMLTLDYKTGQGQNQLEGLIIWTDKMNSKDCLSDSLLGMRIMEGGHRGPEKEQTSFNLVSNKNARIVQYTLLSCTLHIQN